MQVHIEAIPPVEAKFKIALHPGGEINELTIREVESLIAKLTAAIRPQPIVREYRELERGGR